MGGGGERRVTVLISPLIFLENNHMIIGDLFLTRLTCLYVLSATHIMKKNIQVRHRRSRKIIAARSTTGVIVGPPQKMYRSSFIEIENNCSRVFEWKSR